MRSGGGNRVARIVRLAITSSMCRSVATAGAGLLGALPFAERLERSRPVQAGVDVPIA